MSREDNIAAQERFAEGVVSGNLDVIDEVMTDDAVDDNSALEQGPGPEGFKQFFTTLRNAFPHFNIEPEHVVVTNDDVAIAYTLTGTHQQGTYRSLFEAGRSRVGAEEIG
jgi:predicted ester cyclase